MKIANTAFYTPVSPDFLGLKYYSLTRFAPIQISLSVTSTLTILH